MEIDLFRTWIFVHNFVEKLHLVRYPYSKEVREDACEKDI